jgi:hypothetical protein
MLSRVRLFTAATLGGGLLGYAWNSPSWSCLPRRWKPLAGWVERAA